MGINLANGHEHIKQATRRGHGRELGFPARAWFEAHYSECPLRCTEGPPLGFTRGNIKLTPSDKLTWSVRISLELLHGGRPDRVLHRHHDYRKIPATTHQQALLAHTERGILRTHRISRQSVVAFPPDQVTQRNNTHSDASTSKARGHRCPPQHLHKPRAPAAGCTYLRH